MADPRALLVEHADGEANGLAQSLLLVRASTMKMLRLQLAMERRDQVVALEAVDDLVTIDAMIAELLETMPAADGLEPLARHVEEQRSALQREKFGLAAAFVKRAADPAAQWAEPGSAPGPQAANETDPPVGEVEYGESWNETMPDMVYVGAAAPARRPVALWIAAAFLLVVAALAASGLLLGWDPARLLR